jgi:3-isopropylmalate dehydrogenase
MKIIVLPGDGIGVETVSVAVDALEFISKKFKLDLSLKHDIAGHESLKKYGTTIHSGLLESVKNADGLILGPMSTYDFKDEAKGEINPSKFFRKSLDLFANIRPAKTFPGCGTPHKHRVWWQRNAHHLGCCRFFASHHAPVLRTYRSRGI